MFSPQMRDRDFIRRSAGTRVRALFWMARPLLKPRRCTCRWLWLQERMGSWRISACCTVPRLRGRRGGRKEVAWRRRRILDWANCRLQVRRGIGLGGGSSSGQTGRRLNHLGRLPSLKVRVQLLTDLMLDSRLNSDRANRRWTRPLPGRSTTLRSRLRRCALAPSVSVWPRELGKASLVAPPQIVRRREPQGELCWHSRRAGKSRGRNPGRRLRAWKVDLRREA